MSESRAGGNVVNQDSGKVIRNVVILRDYVMVEFDDGSRRKLDFNTFFYYAKKALIGYRL